MKQELTDKHILKLFSKKATQQDAFQMLIQEYQTRLYWHIRKMVFSHDDADDLLQEVFIKVWQNLPKFRGDSSLFTWIYRIATNESLTHIKKKKKHLILSIDANEANLEGFHENDTMFTGSDIEKKLHKSIAQLPEKQRLVFQMKYFEEMKYEEISEVLEVSVGALKASFHHAVKKIGIFIKNELL